MKRGLALFFVGALALARLASAQGVVGDMLAGKLVNPEVGVYVWYDLLDKESNRHYFLRQAIVGEEKVGRKKGYWVETQVVPQVGFPSIYKMLLTGPASEAKNIHQIWVKEGVRPPEQMPLDKSAEAGGDKTKNEKRETVGKDKIPTQQGEIEADHVVISQEDGQKVEVWMNENVRPLGIVKMVSPQGELALQRYGKGGADAVSAMDAVKQAREQQKQGDVQVKVQGGTELPSAIGLDGKPQALPKTEKKKESGEPASAENVPKPESSGEPPKAEEKKP